MKFYVNYNVDRGSARRAGPFETLEVAEEVKKDMDFFSDVLPSASIEEASDETPSPLHNS